MDQLHLAVDDADAPSMLALIGFVLVWGTVACTSIPEATSLAHWS